MARNTKPASGKVLVTVEVDEEWISRFVTLTDDGELEFDPDLMQVTGVERI